MFYKQSMVFARGPDLYLIGLPIPATGSAAFSAQFKNNGT